MSPMPRRHVVADAVPAALGAVHAVDAAVVLLVEAVGATSGGARSAGRGRTRGRAPGRTAPGSPGSAGPSRRRRRWTRTRRPPTAPGAEVVRVTGVDEHRVQHRTVGVFSSRPLLHQVSHIGWSFQPVDRPTCRRRPRCGNSPGVSRRRTRCRAGRRGRVSQNTTAPPRSRRRSPVVKAGGRDASVNGAAEVVRAEHRGPEVAGAGPRPGRVRAIPRVDHGVLDDVAEQGGPRLPAAGRAVTVGPEQPVCGRRARGPARPAARPTARRRVAHLPSSSQSAPVDMVAGRAGAGPGGRRRPSPCPGVPRSRSLMGGRRLPQAGLIDGGVGRGARAPAAPNGAAARTTSAVAARPAGTVTVRARPRGGVVEYSQRRSPLGSTTTSRYSPGRVR